MKKSIIEILEKYSITKNFFTIHDRDKVASEIEELFPKWISVKEKLPEELETVFISNGQGWTSIGFIVHDKEAGWLWAESNGVVYEDGGKIVAEGEIYDLDVRFWHPLPTSTTIKI